MKSTPQHLKALKEIERNVIPSLVEILHEEPPLGRNWLTEGLQPSQWRNQTTSEQKRVGWEMATRITQILCTMLHEAQEERQVDESLTCFRRSRRTSTGKVLSVAVHAYRE